MQQNKELIRCCKKKLRGGRGAFSRAVDCAALGAIVFMVCYMWFSASVANGVARAALSLGSTGFILAGLSLIGSLRLDSAIRAGRRRVTAAELDRRLMLMTDDERKKLIAEHIAGEGRRRDSVICTVCRSGGPVPDDILKAARAAIGRGLGSVVLYYCGPLPDETRAAARACTEVTFSLLPLSSLLTSEQRRSLSFSEEQADDALLAEFRSEQAKSKVTRTSFLGAGRSRGYITAAACLAGLSFFVDNALYYRLMAAACLCFGAAAGWLNSSGAEAQH